MKGFGLGVILLLPVMAMAAPHNNTVKMTYVGGGYGETILDVSSADRAEYEDAGFFISNMNVSNWMKRKWICSQPGLAIIFNLMYVF